MKETLKPLIYRGIKTNYFITSSGEVYNSSNHKLKSRISNCGYVRVAIVMNGKPKHIYVHVAVWESFVGPIPPKMEVNHIHAIKTDNRLSQLELVTKQGNMDHAKRLGLIPKGEECKRSKYSEKTIRQACELLEKGISYKEIAKKTNLPVYIITALANKTIWKHVVKDYNIHNKEMHFYTKTDDLKLINLFASGVTYEDISKKMGLPIKSIKSRLFRLGYKKGTNHIFTKEEEKELMTLYNRGIPCDTLAKKFKVSLRSIYGKIHRLKHK